MNTFYQVTDYNIILVSLEIISLISVGFFFRRSYILCSIFIVGSSSLTVLLLLFIAGGLESPGIFWIFCFHFLYNLFFGIKGSAAGLILTILSIVGFGLVQVYYVIPSIFETHQDYINEKIINLFLFALVNSGYLISFLFANEKTTVEIKTSKNKIENLSKIVLHDISTPISVISGRLKMLIRKVSV